MKKSAKAIISFFGILFIAFSLLTFIAAQDEKKSVNKAEAQKEPKVIKTPRYKILSTFKMPSGILYGVSKNHGFLISFDNGKTWEQRNKGLPKRTVYPFKNMPQRLITNVGLDPLNENNVVITTKTSIYLSTNYGLEWKKIPTGKPLKASSYFTSIAIKPDDPNTLLLGTSFNGFFETRNGGKTWRDISSNLDFLYKGAGFYEEISAITYHPEKNEIIFALGFGNGLYSYNPASGTVKKIEIDFSKGNDEITNLRFINKLQQSGNNPKWILDIRTKTSDTLLNLKNREIFSIIPHPSSLKIGVFKSERKRKASDKFGIYVSSYRANGEYLKKHIEFIKSHGLNSMVVDFKDDYGWITYNTHLKIARKIGSIKKRINLEQLLAMAHKNNIYVIGRIVVFKDKQLYRYKKYKYALWDRTKNAPWRYLKQYEDPQTGEKKWFQREYWVDPYSEFVWKYNTAIAKELQDRGVDEIQFDYIRFPSDGDLSTIQYRYKRKGMTKIDAIESFLRVARESIHIPISTDVYGFNAWYRMGNWIGQSIEMISNYADAISPMFYPSHFPIDFLKDKNYLERAYKIYKIGTQRAVSIVSGKCLIRPFIQAFLIGSELNMSREEYTSYLIRQIQGTLEAKSSGFTLWNASNRYYMVRSSLKPILTSYNFEETRR